MSMSSISDFPRATFLKRLAAMVYDTLVATAVAISSGIIITVVLILLLENNVFSMQGYHHAKDVIQNFAPYQYIIQAWVTAWVLGFFLWFWTNGGQTIGMRAWRLRIQSTNGRPLTYLRMFIRMLASLAGLGTLLIIFNPNKKRALQDLLSQTEVIQLSKEANHHRTWNNMK